MKTLAKTVTIALVLGFVILAPSMANAAPARSGIAGIERSQNLHILDFFFQMLGFKAETGSARHDSHSTKGATTQVAPPTVGGGLGQVSPEEAIWGGGGRCRLGC